MSQNRSHALTSIFILGVLTVGFFFASRVVFSQIHSSVEQAIGTPTATVTPVPTLVVPVAAPHVTVVLHGSKTPLPAQRHTAKPTPAPTAASAPGTAKVVVGTSNSLSSATTAFPSSTGMFYCMTDLRNLPLSTPITFKWVSLPSGSVIFSYTGTYADTYKDSYLDGPLQPGSDRCDVYAPQNGQLQILGSASFTVR
jgi:hypothetical protein